VIEPKRDVEIDLLRWAQVVQSARIEKLARTRILGVVANVSTNKLAFSVTFFSITKVVSVMRLVVSSEGRKNSVSIPLKPQPS
jgi:hypothetical protein